MVLANFWKKFWRLSLKHVGSLVGVFRTEHFFNFLFHLAEGFKMTYIVQFLTVLDYMNLG